MTQDKIIQGYQGQIEAAMRAYYTRYYRDELRLSDWPWRVEARLNEESEMQPFLEKLGSWFHFGFKAKRVLVVGAGTGAESFAFARLGAEVRGIEPNAEALKILHMKAQLQNMNPENFIAAPVEAIPFPSDSFDWVHCFTVLEHVKDVRQAIDEMVRTCKVDGYVFIQTPDYHCPHERHYKINILPFAPRWVNKLYLRLRGRPTRFWDGLNLVTAHSLNRILWPRKDVVTFRAYESVAPVWEAKGLFAWFVRTFRLYPQQYIFLKKIPTNLSVTADLSEAEDATVPHIKNRKRVTVTKSA